MQTKHDLDEETNPAMSEADEQDWLESDPSHHRLLGTPGHRVHKIYGIAPTEGGAEDDTKFIRSQAQAKKLYPDDPAAQRSYVASRMGAKSTTGESDETRLKIADKQLEGKKYGADQQLAGKRIGATAQEAIAQIKSATSKSIAADANAAREYIVNLNNASQIARQRLIGTYGDIRGALAAASDPKGILKTLGEAGLLPEQITQGGGGGEASVATSRASSKQRFSPEEMDAANTWARAHPGDPKAKQILAILAAQQNQ